MPLSPLDDKPLNEVPVAPLSRYRSAAVTNGSAATNVDGSLVQTEK